jgi:hypothetical protein
LCSSFFISQINAIAEWTILIYIQADNNLSPFAEYNIRDMQSGIYANSSRVNLLVQWDQPRNNRTWRYRIVRNGRIEDESLTQEMGIYPAEELINSGSWIKRKYPAKKYAWVLWNHGNGIIDSRTIEAVPHLSPENGWIEIPGLGTPDADRGILYDFTQNTYLTNQGLTKAFKQIKVILGKSIDLIGLDACMMQMIETAYQLKGLTNVIVGSEETEPGYGWSYSGFVRPLTTSPTTFDAKKLGASIVKSYGIFYNSIGESDYTQSAFNMYYLDALKKNIDAMVLKTIECKKYQSTQVKNAIITARLNASNFYISGYVDLFSFYQKLYTGISNIRKKIKIVNSYTKSLDSLKNILYRGITLIDKSIIANSKGYRNSGARGISIYYPNPRASASSIHSSYRLTLFAKKSHWLKFIRDNRAR